MGSPISPIFAELVMEDLETDCFRILKGKYSIVPFLYGRYVDDSIMCIKESDIQKILLVFNSYDSHLQFTCVTQNHLGILNFLDTSISIHQGKMITNWFSKPTSSGRFSTITQITLLL